MLTVARHENTAAFKCRRSDDEIGIVPRIAASARFGPQVGSPVQHRDGYGQDIAIADELEKCVQAPRSLTPRSPRRISYNVIAEKANRWCWAKYCWVTFKTCWFLALRTLDIMSVSRIASSMG